MARPRSEFALWPSQFEALCAPEPEILVASASPGVPAGASYLLRAAALRACSMRPGGAAVVLVQRHETELERVHLRGPAGLLEMVRAMQASGKATVHEDQDEIRFANGSVLSWSGCSREAEVARLLDRRFDVALIDGVEDVPETVFERLRQPVAASLHPGRRLLAAARRPAAEGWAGRYWSVNGSSGRRVVELDPGELDPEMVMRPTFPSYREWIDRHFAGEFIWAPHTPSIVSAIDRWIADEFDHLAVFVPSQHGKCLAVDTPILTTAGWSTMGELRVGDRVYDEHGEPATVTFKSDLKRDRPVWRVRTDDGFSVLADADHRWPVSLDRRCGFKPKTTAQLAARKCRRAPILPIHGAVAGRRARLPVDPWLLGFWLGDGTTDAGTITCGERDLKWVTTKVATRVAVRVKFRRNRAPTIHTHGLYGRLREAGVLGRKHVPRAYLESSREQRLELLRGLVDSDGHVARDGQVEFTSTNERLALDVRELVVGLGIKCQLVKGRAVLRGVDHGPKYRLLFYAAGVASLPRKAARLKESVAKRDRYLVSVEPAGTADVQCIEVDSPSHLFLAGRGLMPTHNTEAGPRHAVPYLLQRFPGDWCAIVSYNNEIANSRSADARENFLRIGGELRPGRKKVKQWLTSGGGGCWSAGMGSGQTGHSNSWGFMDDPDQDWEDAVNRRKAERKRRRYGSVFRARESMFAGSGRRQKLCATVTRWDPEDTIGYAMAQSHAALEENRSARERWAILAIPAVYDPAIADGYRKLYPLFEVLPDYRSEAGEPIWPERRSAADWRVVFRIRGPIIAACECQQSPRGVERGGQFESSWFVRRDRDPAFAGASPNEAVYEASTRAWDLAATEGGGDWTSGAKLGRLAEGGDIVVRHVARGQYAPVGVKHLIAATMVLDGPRVKVRLPIDPAAGGEGWADELVRYLRQVAGWVGMPPPEIVCKRPRRLATASLTAKAARAQDFRSRSMPPAPDMEGGVSFVAASWEPSLAGAVDRWSERLSAHPELREVAAMAATLSGDWWTFWLQVLQAFTGDEARVDDDVDATADAYEELYEPPPAPTFGGSMSRPPGW